MTRTTLTPVEMPKPDGAALALEKLGAAIEELPADQPRGKFRAGLLVARVEPDGPLAAAKVQADDVLVGLGGAEVASQEDLGLLLERAETGQPLRIVVLRRTPRGLYRIITRAKPR